MRFLTLCALGMLLGGCVRVVSPSGAAPDPTRRLGEGCSTSEECVSGFCADHTCCDTACGGLSACNLARAPGTCVPRRQGDTCEGDAACLTGHCVDHVCCLTACEGTCFFCNGTTPGLCTAVPDNEDPRGRCTGDCTACVGGSCHPTAPGTDPHLACGMQRACSVNGNCGAEGGAACVLDVDCAVGNCIAGTCLRRNQDELVSSRLLQNARYTHLIGFDVDELGVMHALLRQTVPTSDVYRFDVHVYYVNNRSGAWTGQELFNHVGCDVVSSAVSAISHVGSLTFVVVPDVAESQGDVCDDVGFFPNTINGRWLEADGRVRVDATLPEGPEGPPLALFWLRAAYDEHADAFVIAYNAYARTTGIQLAEFRLATGTWSTPALMAAASNSADGELLLLDGQPVVFTTANDASTLLATWRDPQGQMQQETAALPCTAVRVSASALANGTQALLAVDCRPLGGGDRGVPPVLGHFDLRATSGNRFSALAEEPAFARAIFTAPVVLANNAEAFFVASYDSPLRLMTRSAQGYVGYPVLQPLLMTENIFSLIRVRHSHQPHVAWTQDLTRGTDLADNLDILSSRVFWASFTP